MEIFNTYKRTRTGYECFINDYIYLTQLDEHYYSVTHVEVVKGDWTGNPTAVSGDIFTNIDDADSYMAILVAKLEKF